ncbi:hypothetical protein [Robiginitalea aurantiaca]|uniref:Outer membrane porin, OprD family n=1 Tax=Robiginitalea aurantiaca TaxID=3056915 RepID=A0ABT7WCM5_9FLAO|nr:hypothetical protein [Robiginitalea aurantiaca]MDM9630661.1 hypothetical protein [Robiginitalea aurantiaca]
MHSQKDVETLSDVFGLGTISGHVRNFFMNTINQGELTDYYANATGGALRIRSHQIFGFELGVAGIFTYKLFSNDLNRMDPITGGTAKFEHQLFDVLDQDNFNDLDRLEELYIRYIFEHGYLVYGKMTIQDTPLMNRSDGRMKPFAFKGVWLHYITGKNRFNLAWIDRISPRSIVEWFDFKEGIGLFNQGFQPDGSEAEYHENLESEGLAMLEYQTRVSNFNLQVYQWYLHNISYTGWLGVAYHKNGWNLGVQYALQIPDGFQKTLEYEKRYVQPEERGQVLSGQIQYLTDRWTMRAAYSRAFASGRFLFPRELGRDQFYTSISRSRLDGFGNTGVLTLGGDHTFGIERFSAGFDYTRTFGPEVDAFKFNKYNLDAYQQVNLRLNYEFKGFLRGLHMAFLYVYRDNLNTDDPQVVFNRGNLHQLNFITNFEF